MEMRGRWFVVIMKFKARVRVRVRVRREFLITANGH